jgi:Tol biopolymer transport system component
VADAQAPAPSRDGVHLAWLRREGWQSFALMVSRADGLEPRVLATALSFQTINRPVWSPDGRRLAYSAGQMFETRNLYVVEVASGRVRQITRFTKSTEFPLAQDWLPDGRHLVVSYYATPRAQLANDLGVLDTESGDITRLTLNVKGLFFEPSVSSDGARVIAAAQGAEREVWKVPLGPDADANGRNAVRLVDASQDPMWTYVTRDGQTLLVLARRGREPATLVSPAQRPLVRTPPSCRTRSLRRGIGWASGGQRFSPPDRPVVFRVPRYNNQAKLSAGRL